MSYYDEPSPVRLSGALGEAWALMNENYEGFDGESAIARSAQDRLVRDWRANGPATVSVFNYRTRQTTTRDVATVREAYRLAIEEHRRGGYATVSAKRVDNGERF